ncbi:Ethanolamine-phosphate cytidylyltransferase [Hibiscus syriacus]|uniref:ethanolamine-phosphate cytidylyltransferase n=1 Tax=Hibiscus syriacus TaxID=106335 RepID=A0A6A3AEY9_HIBSY|nr:Ethanolamine-phosphate cytidylyltransferase [Hibiscus syriacus]
MIKISSTSLIGGAVAVAMAVGLYLGVAIPPEILGFGLRRRIRRKKKALRVYMDGCFDMMHYGHCNALRQARALGDQLGYIHGDDPGVLPDGTDAYALAKKAGRFKQIKRIEGISSTEGWSNASLYGGSGGETRISHFLPTSRIIVQFSNGKVPGPNAHVVYIDGAFDLFHAGHVEILRIARELGDFLIVGTHNDQTISAKRGPHRPTMNLHERSLSVLACGYVDEVTIGVPWEVSKDMISTKASNRGRGRVFGHFGFTVIVAIAGAIAGVAGNSEGGETAISRTKSRF